MQMTNTSKLNYQFNNQFDDAMWQKTLHFAIIRLFHSYTAISNSHQITQGLISFESSHWTESKRCMVPIMVYMHQFYT